jgi:hypothetical protein
MARVVVTELAPSNDGSRIERASTQRRRSTGARTPVSAPRIPYVPARTALVQYNQFGPWGSDLLQLKEGSTPGVRSCFSSRRDRPQGSDPASAQGGIDHRGPILLEPKELPHRHLPNFLRTNSSGDG